MIDTPIPQSGPVAVPERSLGRTVRGVFGHVLLMTLMMTTQLVVFIPAALFHCGLRYGRYAAWAALVLAVMLGSVLIFGSPDSAQAKLMWVTGVVLAVMLPSAAALPMVERGERFGRLLVVLLIGTLLGLAVTEVAMQLYAGFSPYKLLLAEAQKAAADWIKIYRLPTQSASLLQKWGTFILPGTLVIHIAIIYVLSLLMLGRLKAWREHAARRGDATLAGTYLFRNFTLPEWLLFLFVAGGLTPLVHGLLQKVAANVLAVVTFLYLLQGLAIFRALLAAAGVGFTGSMFGWMMLGFLSMFGIGQLLLGLAGLFDPFFNFRHIKRKDDSHESHTD